MHIAAPVWPGHQAPLGATFDGNGVNVAVWAPDATTVSVCLFDEAGNETRIALPEHTDGVWHGYLPAVGPGQRYGFRADGPWDPSAGRVFNPAKLLLDPYARAIDGTVTPHPALAAMDAKGRRQREDSAPYVARGVVTGDAFDWSDDVRPGTPWHQTVIYEAHVKGFTKLHPDVPDHQRGTFAGLGHGSVVGYLRDLGVTAVELLPAQHFVTEPMLTDAGFVNFWGYNTIGYFAPHAGYAGSGTGGEQVDEFKQMVRSLHAAGIELILDVVYNHTAEGARSGPCLSLRGLDDGAYYRQLGGSYADVTGCGNTVNASHPQVLQLIMDSLRYWVTDMHVDGFRFDLASALTRNGPGVDLRAPFLAAVQQDPVLREVKLIAEPWDTTSEGYLLGRFPPRWGEWNDKYRDTVRDFWRQAPLTVSELATRLSGSADLYADDGRLPLASVNFVTSHDGFTLRDLVTYDQKHNESNGENNLDGVGDNRSWNCGVEGETDDVAVNALRFRQASNLLATLLLSSGVPMLVAGDERGRTQRGNNNAYCHDNDVSWVNWEPEPAWSPLHDLTRRLLALRAEHPVLHRHRFFEGAALEDNGRKDVVWLQPNGEEMDRVTWTDPANRTLGMYVAGDALRTLDRYGHPIRDTSYVIWLHADSDPVDLTLPLEWADHYRTVLRTDLPSSTLAERSDDGEGAAKQLKPGSTVTLAPHSLAVFEAVDQPAEEVRTESTRGVSG